MKNRGHQESLPLEVEHLGIKYAGLATPLKTGCREEDCFEMDIVLNNLPLGTIYRGHDNRWIMKDFGDQEMLDKIGEQILLWYDEKPDLKRSDP